MHTREGMNALVCKKKTDVNGVKSFVSTAASILQWSDAGPAMLIVPG